MQFDCVFRSVTCFDVVFINQPPGEAYHSCDAENPERNADVMFAIDGITGLPGPDVTRVVRNASKMNILPVNVVLVTPMKRISIGIDLNAEWQTRKR